MPVVKMPDGALVDLPDNPTPEQLQALEEITSSRSGALGVAKEALKAGPGSFIRGVAGLPDFLGMGNPNPALIPSDEEFSRTPQLTKIIPKPETSAGKAIGAVVEGAGAGLAGPGGFTKTAAAIGGAGGAGGELAARLFGDNALVRFAGSLLGGGLAAGGASLRPNADEMIRTATKGMEEQDWRRAAQTADVLKREEIPFLASQLLGRGSTLDDIVSQASGNQKVKPTLLKALRNVQPQAQKAIGKFQTENLGLGIDERRDLFSEIQRVAKEAETGALNRSNAAYVASMPRLGYYSPEYIQGLKDDIIELARSPKYGKNTAGGNLLTRWAQEKLTLPEGQVMRNSDLNNMIKDLNVLSQQEGWKGLPVGDLKGILKDSTPEFAAARQAKRSVIQNEVNPIKEGLAGQIAQMGGGPREGKYTVTGDIVNLVFPEGKAQPKAIKDLARDIGGDKVGDLLREHLSTSLQKSMKGLEDNPQAPADFVKFVAGTPAQRQNMEAALIETAKANGVNPFAVRNGFYDLMKALGTFKDVKIARNLEGSGTAFEAGRSAAGALVAPQSRVARYFWERATGKTYQRIADIVTSPDGLKTLERIAKEQSPLKRDALVRTIVSSSMAAEGE